MTSYYLVDKFADGNGDLIATYYINIQLESIHSWLLFKLIGHSIGGYEYKFWLIPEVCEWKYCEAIIKLTWLQAIIWTNDGYIYTNAYMCHLAPVN